MLIFPIKFASILKLFGNKVIKFYKGIDWICSLIFMKVYFKGNIKTLYWLIKYCDIKWSYNYFYE